MKDATFGKSLAGPLLVLLITGAAFGQHEHSWVNLSGMGGSGLEQEHARLNHDATPLRAVPVLDGGWAYDEISDALVDSVDSPYVLSLETCARFRITDYYALGDVYFIYDFGELVLTTSGFSGEPFGDHAEADQGWADAEYTGGEVLLTAGDHEITVQGDGGGGVPAGFFVRVDSVPPEIICPDDITLQRGDKLCDSAVSDWLEGAVATDACGPVVVTEDSESNGFACGFPYGSVTEVTWTATDVADNIGTCSATITIEKPRRMEMSRKGSVLIFPKIELRWDRDGRLTQDTFVGLTNDFPDDVLVQLYFFSGDPHVPAGWKSDDREHPGHIWMDNQIMLTANEPAYWSCLTGMPKGVSPFVALDPGDPPGRPDPTGPLGSRMLRGYAVAWAVNSSGEEIRWNHLTGDVTIVNYLNMDAWTYGAMTVSTHCVDHGDQPFDCVELDGNGTCCEAEVVAGVLDLDAFQYDLAFGQLMLDFYSSGSYALSGDSSIVVADTDLTLLPVSADFRQEADEPVVTKAHFDIWNMNEVKFSGTHRCIVAWDEALLSVYDAPNHFLVENLHTNKGKARINGVTSELCEDSESAAIVGIKASMLTFPGLSQTGMSGTNVVGMGTEKATIRFDTVEPPPELLLGW